MSDFNFNSLTSEQLVSADLTEASIDLERVQASDDADADLSNVAYTLQSTVDGVAIPINERKFQEVHYNPDPFGNGNPFAKIQFKIVMKSSNSAIVPEVKDFRAICST